MHRAPRSRRPEHAPASLADWIQSPKPAWSLPGRVKNETALLNHLKVGVRKGGGAEFRLAADFSVSH
jgi:hypothetical protein